MHESPDQLQDHPSADGREWRDSVRHASPNDLIHVDQLEDCESLSVGEFHVGNEYPRTPVAPSSAPSGGRVRCT